MLFAPNLQEAGSRVEGCDLWVSKDDNDEVRLVTGLPKSAYDAIMAAVNHRQFTNMHLSEIQRLAGQPSVVFDLNRVFAPTPVDAS